MSDQEYVFDRTKEQVELDRLRLLESAFDPRTRLRLEKVGVAAGWHCLEVGAGAGSIMGWLSEKVRPTGKVVAIDTNTRFLPASPPSNVEIVRGDIRDCDFGGSRFDLIHGRYVLLHLPDFPTSFRSSKECFLFCRRGDRLSLRNRIFLPRAFYVVRKKNVGPLAG